MSVNRDSYLTFGKFKSRKLKDLPTSYLQWMVRELIDTDLHAWGKAAEDELKNRQNEGMWEDLEEQANQFLRDHGVDPRLL